MMASPSSPNDGTATPVVPPLPVRCVEPTSKPPKSQRSPANLNSKVSPEMFRSSPLNHVDSS